MEAFIVFIDGMVGSVSIVLNEVFSWTICGINLGAIVVIGFILWLVVKLIWG